MAKLKKVEEAATEILGKYWDLSFDLVDGGYLQSKKQATNEILEKIINDKEYYVRRQYWFDVIMYMDKL